MRSGFHKIISVQNPHVKEIVRLRNRRHRDETKLYLVEGYREILRAMEKKASLKSLYFCRDYFLGDNEEDLLQQAWDNGLEIAELSEHAFKKISYRDRPDGLLAIAYQKSLLLDELEIILQDKPSPFLLIVEALEKPGNLGSIIRSADGAGVDAIFVCDHGTDIYNPNVIRSSVGTFFSVPLIQAESKEAFEWLQKRNIPIMAASPSARALYTQVDYTKSVAFAVGREQIGLSTFWMDRADQTVSIPMMGIADSLNVSNAATLLLYEVVRQRKL